MTPEQQLTKQIRSYFDDPLGFVNYVFPWKAEGTAFEHEDGPDAWQEDILRELSDKCRGSLEDSIQIAVASGHGIGKSALVAWIILWFISTREHPQLVVTANTKTQLTTKTWRELSKWHNLAINKHWFTWTATKFYAVDHPSTWFASAIPWSEHNSEAFAGTHEKYVLVIFDEASAVHDSIWEVASGAMTTLGAMWIAFGNPTQNTGRFKECFKNGRFAHRWITRQIDSRTCKKTNKKQLEEWVDDYGEDSDFVRVRVKGEFPRASNAQLISNEVVDIARSRDHHPDVYRHMPITIGCDIARYGDDQTVILVRQGAKIIEVKKFRELSTMQSASHIAATEDEYRSLSRDIIVFVDIVGLGAGTYDRLVELGRNPIGVNGGSSPADRKRYFNLRAEMWCNTRTWLRDVGQLPKDDELKDDLTGVQYGFSASGQIQLEKKEDMKKRGLRSPDCGDALAMTHAYPNMSMRRGRLMYDEDEYDAYPDIPRSQSITGY